MLYVIVMVPLMGADLVEGEPAAPAGRGGRSRVAGRPVDAGS